MAYNFKLTTHSGVKQDIYIGKYLFSVPFGEIVWIFLSFTIIAFFYWINVIFLNNNFLFGFTLFLATLIIAISAGYSISNPKSDTFKTKQELIDFIKKNL